MKNSGISKRASDIGPSPIRKLLPYAENAKEKGIKVYHINIGQPDIPTPDIILDAMRGFDNPVLPYGPSQGLLSLRVAVAQYFKRFGVSLKEDEVFVTSGGSEAIYFSFMVLLNPGDEVLIPEPYYTNYNGFANMAGVEIVPIPTKAEQGFHLPDKDIIEGLVTPKTKAILICSPNNPTGVIYDENEINAVLKLSEEHNLYILSDEVYREFIFNDQKPFTALSLDTDRVIVLDSISKRFSACGARIGFIITKNKAVLENTLKYGQARLCPPTIEQYGAKAGFEHIDEFLSQMIEEYKKRRNAVFSVLNETKFAFAVKPNGAFYTVLKLPVKDADQFARWLLTSFNVRGETVMIAPAAAFYRTKGAGENEARIAYVLESEKMRQAMFVLNEGLQQYKREVEQ